MKKNFRFYVYAWSAFFVLFNILAFVVPTPDKYNSMFWVGYILISLFYVGHLACAYHAFHTENLQKMFYNLPLVSISYTTLILSFIVGTAFMILSFLPVWMGIVISAVLFAFSI